MAISFVAVGTEDRVDNAAHSAFTLNKPAGVAEGDFMLGVILTQEDAVSVNALSGWTAVTGASLKSAESDGVFLTILKRTAGPSDPASWGGTFSTGSAGRHSARVYAWRDCADASSQMLVSDGLQSDTNASSLATPTINNTDANGWRVCAWGHHDTETGGDWTSNEVSTRGIQTAGVSSNNIRGLVADSNAAVATGNTSRTGTAGSTYNNGAAWIGILRPSGGTATAGTVVASAEALDATVSVKPSAGTAASAASVTTHPLKRANAGTATASAVARGPMFMTVTQPAVVTVNQPSVRIGPSAGTVTAVAVSVAASRGYTPTPVSVTGTAFAAGKALTADAGAVSASVTVTDTPGLRTVTVTVVAYNVAAQVNTVPPFRVAYVKREIRRVKVEADVRRTVVDKGVG